MIPAQPPMRESDGCIVSILSAFLKPAGVPSKSPICQMYVVFWPGREQARCELRTQRRQDRLTSSTCVSAMFAVTVVPVDTVTEVVPTASSFL